MIFLAVTECFLDQNTWTLSQYKTELRPLLLFTRSPIFSYCMTLKEILRRYYLLSTLSQLNTDLNLNNFKDFQVLSSDILVDLPSFVMVLARFSNSSTHSTFVSPSLHWYLFISRTYFLVH
jgi:hypothetical protein